MAFRGLSCVVLFNLVFHRHTNTPSLNYSDGVFVLCYSQARYVQAKLSVHDRSLKVATVIESLEMEMELLCLTGVEDQLQADVRPTLETLRNAGIKVWLT